MFSGRTENKILAWREFRNSLNSWPEDIHTVAKVWGTAPLTNNYLTFDNHENWPDPWSLITDSVFCDISVALGMFYTLYYSSYENKESMQLQHYQLIQEHQILNLVSLEDGKYMLNYHVGRPVNIQQLEGTLPKPKYVVTAKDLPIKI